jgi:hypothetical protein
LIGTADLQMHSAQLLVDSRIFGIGDEVEIGSQRFQRTQRLPQLMRKISQYVLGSSLSHSSAS